MKQPIIHYGVKTKNILLDEKWVADISNFGLPINFEDNMMINTFVNSMPGYLDQDFAWRQ
jgi:hypothetical protein